MKKKLIVFLLVLILIIANLTIVYIFFGHDGKTVVDNQPVVTNDSSNSAAEALPQDNNISIPAASGPADNTTNNIPAGTSPAAAPAVTGTPSVSTLNIINRLVSWGFTKATGRVIDTIIIHTSYAASGADPFSLVGTIAEYRAEGVSPHYVIDRAGNVYRLVADADIAYHAGLSKMPDGRTDVNDFSLGIEVINTMTDKPTDAQYSALKNLLAYLEGKYKIKYVLGHNQIAPGRKTDPWNFDWSRIK